MLLQLFCVDQDTSNDLIPAAQKLIMLSRLLIVPGVNLCLVHWGRFVLACAEAHMVYGAAGESQDGTHQSYSEALHLFTLVVGDIQRVDLWCEAVYSCSQEARTWFDGGSC